MRFGNNLLSQGRVKGGSTLSRLRVKCTAFRTCLIAPPEVRSPNDDHAATEIRNASADMILQTILGSIQAREGGGVSSNARRSNVFFRK